MDNTTCKRLRHRACTHAQSRFHGNSGSQATSLYPSYRLRVDRRKTIRCIVNNISLKNVNVYVWTGPKFLKKLLCGFDGGGGGREGGSMGTNIWF